MKTLVFSLVLVPFVTVSAGAVPFPSALRSSFAAHVGSIGQNDGIPSEYTVTDLGTGLPNSPGLAPTAVNDLGVVVGTASGALLASLSSGNGNPQAFLFAQGTLRALPALPGDLYTFADAINDAGQISGGSANNTAERATLWHVDGSVINLGFGLAGSQNAEATGINNNGEIVGVSVGNAIGSVPTIFGAAGAAPACGSAPVQGVAWNVNNHGLIVGQQSLPQGGAAGFSCLPFTVIESPPLPTMRDFAKGVNDAGQIVGRLTLPSGIFHGYLYQAGRTTDMGTLFPRNPNAVSGSFAINNAGEAIGFSAEGGATPGHPPINPRAFIYANGRMVDLNGLLPARYKYWRLAVAESINCKGQIAGGGYVNGVEHGFLLNPIYRDALGRIQDDRHNDRCRFHDDRYALAS